MSAESREIDCKPSVVMSLVHDDYQAVKPSTFQGFEPRGTDIMKRVVTHQDTLRAAMAANELECNYRPRNTARKRRNAQSLGICKTDRYRLF